MSDRGGRQSETAIYPLLALIAAGVIASIVILTLILLHIAHSRPRAYHLQHASVDLDRTLPHSWWHVAHVGGDH